MSSAFPDKHKSGAVILIYHRLIPDESKLTGVSREGRLFYTERQFRRHMDSVAKNFNPITMDQFASGTFRENSIVITFDDGPNSDLLALKVLKEYEIPATFYMTSNNRDRLVSDAERAAIDAALGDSPSGPLNAGEEFVRPMAWEMMRGFAREPLVTIGAHSHDHTRLTTLDGRDAVRENIRRNKELLQEELGVQVQHFAYPFGAHSPQVEEVVADLGFETAVIARPGWNVPSGSGRYRLRRCRPEYLFLKTDSYASMRSRSKDPTCSICGGNIFKHRSATDPSKVRCKKCRSLPRHRNVNSIIRALPHDFLNQANLLEFTMDPSWRNIPCKSVTLSRYGEAEEEPGGDGIHKKSYDATNIACGDGAYDVIIACQVLTSIENDARAFQEIMRILSVDGVFVFTVSYSSTQENTESTSSNTHKSDLRIYGRDIATRLAQEGKYQICTVEGFDPVDFAPSTAFIGTHSPARAREISEMLEVNGEFAVSHL